MLTGTSPRGRGALLALALASLVALAGPAHAEDLTDVALHTPGRLDERVHVARIGNAGVTPGATIPKSMHRRDGATFDDVAVVERRGKRVRILHDEDEARILMWIEAADLGWAIVRDTQVAGKGDVGVWLLRGAKITVKGSGARRRVSAAFGGELAVSGGAPAAALGKFFKRADEPAPLRDPRHAAAILDAPGGKKLLATPNGVDVEILDEGRGGWALAEHRAKGLRVRGWIETAKVSEPTSFGTVGGGSGYGMNHTRRVDVAAGTCLHASPGGPVVGMQLEDAQRYTPRTEDGWWEVYVGNAWGLFTVHARATSTDAAGKPVFARCK